jgi:hypothetical protein
VIVTRVFLSCNDIECIRDGDNNYKPDQWFATARQARFAAKKDGWTHPRDRDLCPKHSKEPTQ